MSDTAIAALETLRSDLNKRIDDAISTLRQGEWTPDPSQFRQPTLEDGRDPRNKNGQNLTERGVEILFRVFDDGGGYNRAGKMLGITQAAAKNRKGQWLAQGGPNRTKRFIPEFDTGAC